MSYWANPLFDLNREGVIYYYNGVVNKDSNGIKSKGFLIAEPKKIGKWDNFDPLNGNYQIFFSANFFGSLLNRIASDKSFNIYLNSDNLPTGLPFQLNINFLSQIYPGVIGKYPADLPIYINGTFTNSNFTQKGFTPSGQISFLFTIYTKGNDTLLLQWTNILDFSVHYTYTTQVLNLVLESDASLVETIITAQPLGTVDVNTLGNWVENTFAGFDDLSLLNPGLDLSIIFKSSDKNFIADNGILIYGNYINTLGMKEFKEILEEKIKRLI